ncbi:major facilitator superfamily domain-containing protein [Truncatella angustata]|uniref:Major facilitator superfamily domain-containing protein n=1 Tax=Truncatella angustata TaxID=152316 RepID=A0A9P8UF39_9PEZI|nr:major facilitator superfamily domain-containing protein [Truncatella angustata]KAH6648823.1 major facilitator superfamily domain-containing protein [Truncatella angustata]
MGQHTAKGRDDAIEGRPLLSSSDEVRPSSPTDASPTRHVSRCSWPWIYVISLCIGVAVISDIGESLFAAPRVRLFESVACTDYYSTVDPSLIGRDGQVPERLCKVDPVQDKVASILGWQFFFDSLPAILLPVPFGYLADQYGRKWIMTLAMMGYLLSCAWPLFALGVLHLSLRSVWASSLFFLICGGPTIATTMLTTIVADVVPSDFRSTAFFYRFCADLVAELVAPPVASALMAKSLWSPLLLALAFQAVAVLMMAVAVPETLPVPYAQDHSSETADSQSATSVRQIAGVGTLYEKWQEQVRKASDSFVFLTRDATVAALVFTFMISKVGRQASNILFQYVSKRYGWSLSQAGMLLSLRAAVNIVLFTVILPSIATLALSRWGLILFTLGTGFPPILRSLVTSLVESHHESKTSDIARLYAVISVVEGIGSLVAAPGMALAFRIGIKLGQEWLGLPFGFAGVLFGLVAIIVFSVKVKN